MDTDITIRPVTFTRRRDDWLQSFGDAMQRHRAVIQGIQWTVVLFYLVLVAYPAFRPLPPPYAHVYDNLTLFDFAGHALSGVSFADPLRACGGYAPALAGACAG